MKIGIFPNINKLEAIELTEKLFSTLERESFVISDEFKENFEDEICKFGDISKTDIIISLGGDGTLIKAARLYSKFDIPILGINLGHLGFLTEVKKEDFEIAVQNVLKEKYYTEDRMMLDIKIYKNDELVSSHFSLNDLVLSRKSVSRMTNTKVYVNNQFVDCFKADGIIISTPTGSTAYSLSAGGPIVDPQMNLMLITPICPHSLHSRSFVVSEDKVISLVPEVTAENELIATKDGQEIIDIEKDMKIEVRASEHKTKFIKFNFYNFYDNIHSRLFERQSR